MSKTKHEGKTVIKCTAEGNPFAPQISWKIDEGPEILGKLEKSEVVNFSFKKLG